MATLQAQLNVVAKSLKKLAKDIEKASKEAAKLNKPKKSAPKKAKPKAKKSPAKRAPKKKAAPRKKSSAQGASVLDAVFDAVKRSRKGASITQLKNKTGLQPRQLSNALYKLSKRGDIVAVSRGVYKKK
jgi:predicted Rossmann fold nucleotide-binding protein DprA/Smf involved in DNA uptake